MKLLIATTNLGKIHEFENLLVNTGFAITTPLKEGVQIKVEENEETFEGNAQLKAEAFAKATGLLCIADDSGLEVDALNGEPGVKTARYAGDEATDEDRQLYLLNKLRAVPMSQRGATFRCVIAIAESGHPTTYATGAVRGIISKDIKGTRGFGYDPIFYIPELKKRLSEFSTDEKNEISHRGIATRAAELILSDRQKSSPDHLARGI
jgi:XTP/dITP diphosphohydrolase